MPANLAESLYNEYRKSLEILKPQWEEEMQQVKAIAEAQGKKDAPKLYEECVEAFCKWRGRTENVIPLLENYIVKHSPSEWVV